MKDLGENNDINILATNSPIIINNDIKVSKLDIQKDFDDKFSNKSSDISQKEENGEKKMNKSVSSIILVKYHKVMSRRILSIFC